MLFSVYMNILKGIVLDFIKKELEGEIRKHALCYFLIKLKAGEILKWIQHGPKIIRNWYQMVPPKPHPRRQQKSPASGQANQK